MTSQIVIYTAAALTSLWGIAHLTLTKNIVKDFGAISTDNKHIITIEWIIEGVTLIIIGVLLAVVTPLNSSNNRGSFVEIKSFAV